VERRTGHSRNRVIGERVNRVTEATLPPGCPDGTPRGRSGAGSPAPLWR